MEWRLCSCRFTWERIPAAILLCCRWWATRLQSWNFTWRSAISRWRPDSTSSSSAHPSPLWNGTPSHSPPLPRRTSSVCTSVHLETGQRHYWKPLGQRDRPPGSSVICQGETTTPTPKSLFHSSRNTSNRKISKCINKLSISEIALHQTSSLGSFKKKKKESLHKMYNLREASTFL